MIYDSLSKFSFYAALNPLFNKVNEIIKSDFDLLNHGRNELEDGISVIISSYMTKSAKESFIECHRRFIDIQFLLEGEEKIGICSKYNCEETSEYVKDKDIQEISGCVDFLTLRPGQFVALFPQDGHMPGIISGEAQIVKKIVVKVPFL